MQVNLTELHDGLELASEETHRLNQDKRKAKPSTTEIQRSPEDPKPEQEGLCFGLQLTD